MSKMNSIPESLLSVKEPLPSKITGDNNPFVVKHEPGLSPLNAMEKGTLLKKKLNSPPEQNPDFKMIKFVSSVVLFFLKKCWRTCSTGVFIIFVMYWCYGSVIALFLFFFGISGLFYQISDWLLYHPDEPAHSRLYVPMPSLIGLPSESLNLKTTDGVQIHAVFIKQEQSIISQVPTVLFLHGNAGNIGHRLAFVQGFYNVCRCNVLLIEYRGYGHSKGYPSEEGLYMDAQAGLKFLLQVPYIDRSKIIVFGRSLGGAVAIDLVCRPEFGKNVLFLAVENTFTSIPDTAKVIFNLTVIKWLPVWAYKNKFDSSKKICNVKRPTLFLSGKADQLIPPQMMQNLYQLCGSSLKRLMLFETGTHNETWQCKGYYRAINMFIDDVMMAQHQPQQWDPQHNTFQRPMEIY